MGILSFQLLGLGSYSGEGPSRSLTETLASTNWTSIKPGQMDICSLIDRPGLAKMDVSTGTLVVYLRRCSEIILFSQMSTAHISKGDYQKTKAMMLDPQG